MLAKNDACEVHRFWIARANWYLTITINCSPEAYHFKKQAINLGHNMEINFTAEEKKADWARILWRVDRDKRWVRDHAHTTLDYVEVCYPGTVKIIINRPWPWPDIILYYKAPRTFFIAISLR